MGSRSRRSVLSGPPRLAAAAFVALCLLPTCSSREAHDATPTRDAGSSSDDGRRALHAAVAALDLAPLSARVPPRRALAQTPDASAAAPDPDPATSVTASDLTALVGYMRDDVDRRVVTLTADVALTDGEPLPPVEKTITVRGACGSSGADACVLDARGSTRHVVVGAVGSLRLENVILRNGAATRDAPPSSDGGAVFVFGAFHATRVAFEDCAATADGTSDGGSVAVAGGEVFIEECAFARSVAADDGGAVYASSGTVEIRRSTFETCAAGGLGGGVAGDAATFTLRYCAFDARVTAREEASRDAYVGARGAVYLEPFAIYSDYYGADGALLAEDATGAALGPPEGFAYRAEGAGLVARAGFEPPPPGMGFAPPPWRAPPSETSGEPPPDAAPLADAIDADGRGVDRTSLAAGVAAVVASLWMLGRFLAREHHTRRPSERALKRARAADDAMLELWRADDDAARAEKKAGKKAVVERERARSGDDAPVTRDSVAMPQTFSTMPVVVEARDELARASGDENDDEDARFGRDAGAPPVAASAAIPALEADEAEADSPRRSAGEDDAFGTVENRAVRREAFSGEAESRGRADARGRGRHAGRRPGKTSGRDDSEDEDGGSPPEGVFDAPRARSIVEGDFVRAAWVGAAAAARAAGESSGFRGPRALGVSADSGSACAPAAREEAFETRETAPSASRETRALARAAANAQTRASGAEVGGDPAVAASAGLASIASASTAARAALATRRGAVDAARGRATVRAGSADALRARVEAARRAARER